MNAIHGYCGLSLLLSLTACGATDGTDATDTEGTDTGTVWEPLTEFSCVGADADAVLPLGPKSNLLQTFRTTSPTKYSNPACSKSWVAVIPKFYPGAGLNVIWTDRWLRNRTQCEGGSLTVRVMSRTTKPPIPVNYRDVGTFSAPLVWATGPNWSACFYPHFVIPPSQDMEFRYGYVEGVDHFVVPPLIFLGKVDLWDRSVKVAAQALTPAGSTQSVYMDAYLASLND